MTFQPPGMTSALYNFIRTLGCWLEMVLFMIPRVLFAEDETDLAWLLVIYKNPKISFIRNSRKEVGLKEILMMLVVFAKMDYMIFVNIESQKPHVSPSSYTVKICLN